MSVQSSAAEIRTVLEADFKKRVAAFYRSLQITPPYHSVEKALLAAREALGRVPLPALQALMCDQAAQGSFFTQILQDSGLAHKHRGIIKSLLATGSDSLPPECRPFVDAYRN